MLHPLTTVRMLSIRCDLQRNSRIKMQVLGNQVQLQQVILNLVMNAIESMSSSQTRVLRIKTALSQTNTVYVSIEDTGMGIKESDLARLFQPMFTTKERGMNWCSPVGAGAFTAKAETARTSRRSAIGT